MKLKQRGNREKEKSGEYTDGEHKRGERERKTAKKTRKIGGETITRQ